MICLQQIKFHLNKKKQSNSIKKGAGQLLWRFNHKRAGSHHNQSTGHTHACMHALSYKKVKKKLIYNLLQFSIVELSVLVGLNPIETSMDTEVNSALQMVTLEISPACKDQIVVSLTMQQTHKIHSTQIKNPRLQKKIFQ